MATQATLVGYSFGSAAASNLANNVNIQALNAVLGYKLDTDNGLLTTTGSGGLVSTGPLQLRAGYQESGVCGNAANMSANANIQVGVNFKTTLPHIPTSVTLTPIATANVQTVYLAGSPTRDGFFLGVSSSGTAFTEWLGTYTTVGNTLLAVDSAARTFDHHCDGCGTTRTGLDVQTSLVISHPSPTVYGITIVCPSCGACDCPSVGLGSADEHRTDQHANAPLTEGAKALRIRLLLRMLGLPLRP